jgi:pyruvate dehydrogenase (quinone)
MAESSRIVADLVVERLRAWQVPRVFGYSGDGVEGLVDAFRRADGDPSFVTTRQEQTAALMAAGHAKYTGGVGVCVATHGPGAVQVLSGLYDAKLESKPLVAIVGQQTATPLGRTHRQEIEIGRLFSDVCEQFLQTATTPEQVPLLFDQAFRTAVATRSPTCVVLPQDLQMAPVPDRMSQNQGVIATAPGLAPARVVPHDRDLNAAAQLLSAGQRVAIVVGQGAAGAAEDIIALADRLDAGVTASLLGKPVLDERLPFHTGVMGQLGTPASAQLLGGCDTLLLVGTNAPWTEYFPPPGQAAVVQIDIDGRKTASRYPVNVPLIGDATETLRALLPRVPQRSNRDWRDMIEMSVDRWRMESVERARVQAQPINPQLVLQELAPLLPRDANISVDVGSVTYWYARHLELSPGVNVQLSSTFASMGCALPYALAAKLAAPNRPVIALSGDGAMQMAGLAELITVADRWRQWADPRLIVLVLNNRDQAETSQEQRERHGRPLYPEAERLPDVPYAAWAHLLGLHGTRVDRPDMVGPAWAEALAADRPTVIEAVVDPTVPLHPPEQPFADLRELFEDGETVRRMREHMMRA